MADEYKIEDISPEDVAEKKYLKKVLKPNYSPWDFELVGNEYTKSINPKILLNKRNSHMYFNFTRIGGRLSDGWEDFLKKELCLKINFIAF